MKVGAVAGWIFFFLSFRGEGDVSGHSPMHLLVPPHWLGSHSTSWVTSQPLTFTALRPLKVLNPAFESWLQFRRSGREQERGEGERGEAREAKK